MKTACIAVLLIVFAASASLGQPLLVEDLRDFHQRIAAAQTQQQRSAIYREIAANGDAIWRRGEDGFEVYFSLAANAFYRDGLLREAQRLHVRVVKRSQSPRDEAMSQYMLGRIQEDWQNWRQAADHYREQIEIFSFHPGYAADLAVVLEAGVSGQAYALQRDGRVEEAISARHALIDEFADDIPPEMVARALAANAVDARRVGQLDLAREYYDELFERFPDRGFDDGSRIRQLRARAATFDADRLNDDYIRELWAIWDTARVRQQFASLAVGNELVRVLRDRKMLEDAAIVSADVVAHAFAREEQWLIDADQRMEQRYRDHLRTALTRTMRLASDTDDYSTAYWAALHYANLFDTPQNRSGAKIVERMESKLFR